MVQISDKPFTQLQNLNLTDELRIQGVLVENPDFGSVSNTAIPVKDETGNGFSDSGIVLNPVTGELDSVRTINVPQSSLNIGETIALSQATSDIIRNTPLQIGQAEIITAPYVTATGSFSGPCWQLLDATETRTVQSDDTEVITTNPLSWTQNNGQNEHRTQLIFKANGAMTNVKIRVIDSLSGAVIKNIPSKNAWDNDTPGPDFVPGFDFIAGTNTIFLNREDVDTPGNFHMGITPMRLRGIRDSDWELKADSVDILGDSSEIPFLQVEDNPMTLTDVLNGEDLFEDLTDGSLFFSSNSLLAQDNDNLFWDRANARLGVGTNTPTVEIDLTGQMLVTDDAGTGIQYAVDYSGTFVNRSLIDKEYVDEAVQPSVFLFGSLNVSSTTTDRYLLPGAPNRGALTDIRALPSPHNGTLKNLYVHHQEPGNGSGDVVYTVQVNGSNTSITVTIDAGSGTLTSDTSNTALINSGDEVSVIVTKAGSVGQSPLDIIATMELV